MKTRSLHLGLPLAALALGVLVACGSGDIPPCTPVEGSDVDPCAPGSAMISHPGALVGPAHDGPRTISYRLEGPIEATAAHLVVRADLSAGYGPLLHRKSLSERPVHDFGVAGADVSMLHRHSGQ